MQSIVLPKPLIPGDAIGVFAPASPFDTGKLNKGLALLSQQGYRLVVPADLVASHPPKKGLFAGSDTGRRKQFNRLARDSQVRGLMAVRGGYGCMRMVSGLDWPAVARSRAAVVGFSDVSALINVGLKRSGLAMMHGPTVTGLASIDEPSLEAFFNLLQNPSKGVRIRAQKTVVRTGKSRGPVVGGNLATLCHLAGTDMQPDWKGCLVFLEDRGEPPYKIDRMLTQMRLAGYFERIAGLFLGSFEACGNINDQDMILEIIASNFESLKGPILAGFPMGHGACNHAFWLGPVATLDTGAGTLTYDINDSCASHES